MSDWSSDVCSSDLTAPLLFGQRFMAPILRAWLDAHPAMTASALFVDRNVNLLEEGLDLALRIGELPDSSLAARRVGAVRRVVRSVEHTSELPSLMRTSYAFYCLQKNNATHKH